MKSLTGKPKFFEGVAVALVISAVAAIMFSVLSSMLGGGWLFRLLIAAMAFVYMLYLLGRSSERVGRVTVVACWITGAGLAWLLSPPFTLYVLIHVGMIWLIRSLYYYTSVFSSIADLGLSAFSVVIAVWAGLHTNSLFLSLWCFFLLQALYVLIPASMKTTHNKSILTRAREDRFESAYRNAQTAVRKLTSGY